MMKKLMKILMGIAGIWLLLAIGMVGVFFYYSQQSIDSQATDPKQTSDAAAQ